MEKGWPLRKARDCLELPEWKALCGTVPTMIVQLKFAKPEFCAWIQEQQRGTRDRLALECLLLGRKREEVVEETATERKMVTKTTKPEAAMEIAKLQSSNPLSGLARSFAGG